VGTCEASPVRERLRHALMPRSGRWLVIDGRGDWPSGARARSVGSAWAFRGWWVVVF
jgi:hypothetical protein